MGVVLLLISASQETTRTNLWSQQSGMYEGEITSIRRTPRGINNPGWEFRNRRLRNSISVLDYIICIDDNHAIGGVDEYISRQPPVHQILCVLKDIV